MTRPIATPVIIEAAINGSTPKSTNPNTPRSPEEIADDALRCLDAGASIIHSHTDQPGFSGTAPHDAGPYRDAWERILAARPDALLHPTVPGGGPGVAMKERYAHVAALAEAGVLAFAPLDAGSMNVGGVEEEGLPRDVDSVFQTTFRDIRYAIDTAHRLQIGLSASIFEPGFLRTMLAFQRAGRLPPGTMLKLYFGARSGLSFGLPPTPMSLQAYLQMLEGTDTAWFVSAIGGDVVESGLAREAIERGGHVVVGIEPYGGTGTPTNVALVEQAVALAGTLGRPVAGCAEAAQIVGLPPRPLSRPETRR